MRLGCTSFGGPIAHLGYFHDEFVIRKKWFDEHSYADLVSVCQFLPGPASSQVGIAIGLSRAGLPGAIAAWTGFTLPSAAMMIAFAFGISAHRDYIGSSWLHGLKLVAVAIVAQALWGMGRKLCPDIKRMNVALVAAVGATFLPTTTGQIGVLIFGAIFGICFIRETSKLPSMPMRTNISPFACTSSLLLFFGLLILLPIFANHTQLQSLKLFDSFFRSGSLVFGGGHVVLALLKTEVVNRGWVSTDAFMAGYGAAQAIPGPLFTFTAYLGAISNLEPSGILGGSLCLIAAFLPSFFLVIGVLPVWEKLRQFNKTRYAMLGINAAVVGLLLAAFYNPVWISAISSPRDLVFALACLFLLIWKVPSWVVVICGALGGRLCL